MKYAIAMCIFFGALCAVGYALDCPVCDRDRCPDFDPKSCRVGVTKDVCACCSVCYKAIGEECGGPWNVFGTCAGHLTCVKPLPPSGDFDPVFEFNAKGKCLALP